MVVAVRSAKVNGVFIFSAPALTLIIPRLLKVVGASVTVLPLTFSVPVLAKVVGVIVNV